jgi:hypothetical protein
LRAAQALLLVGGGAALDALLGRSVESFTFVRLLGAASAPRVDWRPNAPEVPARTLEQALQIARDNGVDIDDDLFLFRLARRNLQHGAEYFGLDVDQSEGRTYMVELKLLLTGDGHFGVTVSPHILTSDDAIVANFAHEVHEAEALYEAFRMSGGRLSAQKLHSLLNETTGLLHCAAWDHADELVRKRHGSTDR